MVGRALDQGPGVEQARKVKLTAEARRRGECAEDGDQPRHAGTARLIGQIRRGPCLVSLSAARDLTQEFFTRLVEKNYVSSAEHHRGRFRSFLRMAIHRFPLNEMDRDRALRRGGGAVILPMEVEAAEGRYRREPSHGITPEAIYERRWALTVLERALNRLKEQDSSDRFEALAPFLTGDAPRGASESVAAGRGMSERALKVAVHLAAPSTPRIAAGGDCGDRARRIGTLTLDIS